MIRLSKFLLILSLFCSCSPKALTYFNEEEARFKDFSTFRLLNTKTARTNLSKDGREILDILESAIREKMTERGYLESNLSPDLILRYEIVTSQHSEARSMVSPLGPPVSSRTYMESLIILDLLDAGRKKMFWQSSFDLRQQSRDLKQEQATENAVNEIFYSYPYRAENPEPDEELADWKAGRKKLKAKFKEQKKSERELEKQRRKER